MATTHTEPADQRWEEPVVSPVPASSSSPSRLLLTLVFGLIFLLAFAPRLVGLETYVTTDELFWAGRTGNFARALTSGRLPATFQTGHPGVTTMWVGLLGMGPDQAQQLAGDRREVSRSAIAHNPEFLPALFAARRAVALVTALTIAGLVLLAWRLLGPGPALLGGALLALDPFFLAHSQLLHIDALLSSFMALALLAGLVRWLAGGSRAYLLLSAVATGLALLSKTPALFLAAFLPSVALLAAWPRRQLRTRTLWLDLLLWSGLAALTYVVLWPALWSAPLETLRGLVGFVGDNTDPDSNPLFYPAAFALRTTPLALLGLLLLPIEALLALKASERVGPNLPTPAALLAYALLFGLAMAVAAKSFDRYLLPAFPAVSFLAGLGLALGVRRLRWIGGAGQLLAATCLLPLLAYPLAISLPYALTWYNPLAGGGSAAQQVLAVGWGEGLDLVARHLNAKPNAAQLKVGLPGEIYTTVLDAQFVGQVMPIQGGDPSAGGADYFVTYLRSPQEALPTYDPRFQAWPPEAVVRLAGIEYARVYPLEVGIPLGARFGDLVVLEGYGLETLTIRAGRPLDLKLFWRALDELPPNTRVAIVLTDLAGGEITRADPPLGELAPGDLRARTYQPILPASLRPGEYVLWIAVEPLIGRPLPLAGRPSALAPEAPESPTRAVLRTILIR